MEKFVASSKRSRRPGRKDKGPLIATAMSHPTRVLILMAMNTPRRRMSPKLFSTESGLGVRHCAYHFKELADAGCIRLVETRQRRGATEHLYEALDRVLAWTAEWEELPPATKRGVLTSVLGAGVRALGLAIDDGTFERHDDSHLSWNTFELDNQGWSEIAVILDRALNDLIELEEECSARIEAGSDYFLMSYFMSSFESPSRADPLGMAEDAQPAGGSQRPTRNKSRVKRRAARTREDERQVMAKVMSHPTRVRILMAMNTPRRRMSPRLFAEESDLPVDHCAYHFAELEDTACIALVATRKRRGAVEHIYEPLKSAIQWTEDWKLLGPAVRQTVLAAVTRGGVEALGAAIESGTFDAKSDSHLSWSTIRIDAPGWQKGAAIFDRALSELLAVDKNALQRIEAGAEVFTASYFIASFESPRKPG